MQNRRKKGEKGGKKKKGEKEKDLVLVCIFYVILLSLSGPCLLLVNPLSLH